MNKKELQQIIKLGEGFNAEFKKSLNCRRKHFVKRC